MTSRYTSYKSMFCTKRTGWKRKLRKSLQENKCVTTQIYLIHYSQFPDSK